MNLRSRNNLLEWIKIVHSNLFFFFIIVSSMRNSLKDEYNERKLKKEIAHTRESFLGLMVHSLLSSRIDQNATKTHFILLY